LVSCRVTHSPIGDWLVGRFEGISDVEWVARFLLIAILFITFFFFLFIKHHKCVKV
jgi:hypothetical protein